MRSFCTSSTFFTALGSDDTGRGIPLYLYRPLTENYEPSRVERVDKLFCEFTQEYADCRMLDLTKSKLYNDTPSTHGIFQNDGIHYLPEAHRYFAERQWEDIFGIKG